MTHARPQPRQTFAGKDSTRLKPINSRAESIGGAVVPLDVVAHASIRATPDEVRQFRQTLTLPSGNRLPAAFLKQAEDQSVVGLAAVAEAMRRHGLTESAFSTWGVLGAPRFLGRVAMVAAIEKMRAEGAWGISPHLIPHRLLHALSGAVSLAFKIRGPNFGVGGGPSGAGEALLIAAAMLDGARLPGLWVVMTGFDPEPDTRTAEASDACRCNALALALVAARTDRQGLRLRVGGAHVRQGSGGTAGVLSLEAVLDLIETLQKRGSVDVRLHTLSDGICLEAVGVPVEPTPPHDSGPLARHGLESKVRAGAEIQ
jgi:hypothetical protein